MREAFTFESEQFVPSPLEEVFAFFADPSNLELLTPEWLRFKILTPQPIKMALGAKIDYRLHWHGIPLRWRTEIIAWEPASRFEDLQLSGPYKLWRHTHHFAPVAGGTKINDSVLYALPFGMLGRVVHAVSVRRNVEQIFKFRSEKIRALFGGD